MNEAVPLVQTVALAAGLAWASGLRLYLVLFLAGLLAQPVGHEHRHDDGG